MCDTCGCDGPASTIEHRPVSEHPHPHDHQNTDHARAGHPAPARTVRVETAVLAKNDGLAAANRDWFERRQLRVLNLVSSPGAGKTTLLERTLRDLRGAWPWAVIEGDQQTDHDARRIAACGAPVVQINTGTMCHLDARMVADACGRLDPPGGRCW